MRKSFLFLSILLIIGSLSFKTMAEVKVRIKDVARLAKLEEIQLFGYGLIVGLNGTGDKRGVTFTIQSLSNMLQKLGISVDPEKLKVKNVAAVMVTSLLSPFAKVGSRVDVTLSSIGDATSLEGGTLLFTPLQGRDGEIYIVAQGSISIGGFNVTAGGGAAVRKNHPTVGRIPNGGIVKKEPPLTMPEEELSLVLFSPDFSMVSRMTQAINEAFSTNLARALDASAVRIRIPEKYQTEGLTVDFISRVQDLSFVPDTVAKVVINERTGTLVVGKDVRITPVAVAHGNILITIKSTPIISQPRARSSGETVVTEKVEVEVEEKKGRMTLIKGTTVDELINTLNVLEVTPRDMIAIFQALKEAGALQAELIIM